MMSKWKILYVNVNQVGVEDAKDDIKIINWSQNNKNSFFLMKIFNKFFTWCNFGFGNRHPQPLKLYLDVSAQKSGSHTPRPVFAKKIVHFFFWPSPILISSIKLFTWAKMSQDNMYNIIVTNCSFLRYHVIFHFVMKKS